MHRIKLFLKLCVESKEYRIISTNDKYRNVWNLKDPFRLEDCLGFYRSGWNIKEIKHYKTRGYSLTDSYDYREVILSLRDKKPRKHRQS